MRHDLIDQLKWHLRLGKPGPVERVAIAVAASELEETDVDLPTWRRAIGSTRGDGQARERYVRLRVAQLRRELRTGSGPILTADEQDRARWSEELARRAAAFRETPEGEQAYRAVLGVAIRGLWTFSVLYYGAVLLLILIMVVLVST